MVKNLVDTFCDLVKIPSPSGKELRVSKYIQRYLKNIGVSSYLDNSGKIVESNTGNIVAKLGDGNPHIMFVAHMDTVEDGSIPIRPIVRSGTIYSDGTTILGSDDKAGVAALLTAAKELRQLKNLPSILCVFSIREESGVMGVNELSVAKNIEFVFDVDGSDPPGTFTNKALGDLSFEIQIYGKEAHAAANPDKGLNAIKTAGIIVSKLKFGRDSKGNVLNIGTISGGTRDNVIPGRCILTGETRAYRISDINKNFKKVDAVVRGACKVTGCSYKLLKKELCVPLYTARNEKIIKLAKKATNTLGIPFLLLTTPATIQGNALAAKGYKVLGLSKGGQLPHSKSESIAVKELEQTKRLIVEIAKNARQYLS